MCNEKKQGSNQMSNVKSGVTNNIINKQRTFSSVATMCTNEGVDFQIHTNIKLNYNRRIQVYFFVCSIISLACIFGLIYTTCKFNAELVEIQSHLTLINKRLSLMSEKCVSVKNVDNIIMNTLVQLENDTYESVPFTEKSPTETVDEVIDDLDYLSEEDIENKLNSRLRRANQRNRQGKRRVVKSSGSLAAHFKGGLPQIVIKDQGLIGPWYPDNTVSRQYKFPKFHLTEGKCSIEVTESALYFIYAQVYYVTSNAVNSYSLYVRSEGSSQNNIIAKCSTSGPNNSHVSEISCYTAAVYNLKANDRIFMKQTEKNRTVILSDGHSFFGIVRLNNSKRVRP